MSPAPPRVRDHLHRALPERQKQALARKEIDLGLARFADTVNIHPLLAETIYRESMVLVVSDEHPLRDRKLVSLPELAGSRSS